MPVRVSRTLRQIFILLLAGFVLGAVLTCEFHVTLLDHEHHHPDQHSHGSPQHAAFDVFCLMAAVLPSILLMLILLSVLFQASPLLRTSPAPVFLPFKPPKSALR